MRALGWFQSLVIAALATTVALAVQAIVRQVWQIRSLPERLMEALLLFVPLDLFERGLQQFGTDAKDIGLIGTALLLGVALLALGLVALRRGWSSWRLLALGGVLWLVTMGVLMPLTGGGPFAMKLAVSPLLVNSAFLVGFLAYASVLLAGRVLAVAGTSVDGKRGLAERRALLAGLGGTLVTAGIARFAGREGGVVTSSLPLAAAPTPRPTPAATPTLAADLEVPAAAPTVEPEPPPTPVPLPTPAERVLDRNKDGALTAAGRPMGSLAPAITSNQDFYVVTKNAVGDPLVDAASWRLIIDGDVEQPVQLDYRILRMLPSVEITKTLECISNFTAQCSLASFGCDLISTARWRGVPLHDVLDLAGGLKSGVVALAFLSIDEFSAGLPPEVAEDPESLIVYEMNGVPLPREHGYPARLLVPGRYGMKNPKWLSGIRALREDFQGWYEQRNWNKDGIVKTMARIDVPADDAALPPGPQRLAGIAYAGRRGIQMVEYSLDDGETWAQASLLEPAQGTDAMVRWQGSFELHEDSALTIVVRATDGSGEVQSSEFALPQPDGASGRHAVTVRTA